MSFGVWLEQIFSKFTSKCVFSSIVAEPSRPRLAAAAPVFKTGGRPSTRLPPEGLVEQDPVILIACKTIIFYSKLFVFIVKNHCESRMFFILLSKSFVSGKPTILL